MASAFVPARPRLSLALDFSSASDARVLLHSQPSSSLNGCWTSQQASLGSLGPHSSLSRRPSVCLGHIPGSSKSHEIGYVPSTEQPLRKENQKEETSLNPHLPLATFSLSDCSSPSQLLSLCSDSTAPCSISAASDLPQLYSDAPDPSLLLRGHPGLAPGAGPGSRSFPSAFAGIPIRHQEPDRAPDSAPSFSSFSFASSSSLASSSPSTPSSICSAACS